MNTTIELTIDYTSYNDYDTSDNVNTSIITQKETWPELIIEFANLLNNGGFYINIDRLSDALDDVRRDDIEEVLDSICNK